VACCVAIYCANVVSALVGVSASVKTPVQIMRLDCAVAGKHSVASESVATEAIPIMRMLRAGPYV
jgi:hypothetical protein